MIVIFFYWANIARMMIAQESKIMYIKISKVNVIFVDTDSVNRFLKLIKLMFLIGLTDLMVTKNLPDIILFIFNLCN